MTLLQTPLYPEHEKLGARFVPFSGYSMPVQYTSLLEEHQSVRKGCGLFDVSHMGACQVAGVQAEKFLNFLLTRDVSQVNVGEGAYSLFCREDGGCLDDLLFYRLAPQEFLLIFNAGNKEKDLHHLRTHSQKFQNLQIDPLFESHSLLALQGPRSFEVLQEIGLAPQTPQTFQIEEKFFQKEKILLAQSGYTGERGVEILVPNSSAVALWKELLEKGSLKGLKPCGLGARDTLRTEMGYSLYGHELSENINPIWAGLSWAISFSKEDFSGKEALLTEKTRPSKKLICLKNQGRQAPRFEMPVIDSQEKMVGHITSGTFSPSLGHAIGMALVQADSCPPYSVLIRGEKVAFDLCKRPFYTQGSLAKKEK